MSEKQFKNETGFQETENISPSNLLKEKRKHHIYKFLQSYVVSSKTLKIFLYFDCKNEMSKIFKEVIQNKFEMTDDDRGRRRIELDI